MRNKECSLEDMALFVCKPETGPSALTTLYVRHGPAGGSSL